MPATGRLFCLLTAFIWAFPAVAGERAAALVNSFQVMCTLEPLNFERSETKAAAMHLPVKQDLHGAGGAGHAKSWILPLKSGPHEFVVTEVHGPKADVKTCASAAIDVGGDDFKAELTKAMRLGPAAKEDISTDGQYRTSVWPWANGTIIMLTDATPKSRPGINVLLMERKAK